MPTLNWLGKDKVINHHQDVPFRVLDRKYAFGASSDNMLIKGDNLHALKALLPQYEGRVKCIYIDPPYNTGNEGWDCPFAYILATVANRSSAVDVEQILGRVLRLPNTTKSASNTLNRIKSR